MDMSKYYLLVYQGGHHDVWCNGKDHIWMLGWRFGDCGSSKDRTAEIRFGKCDCEEWKQSII